MKKLILLISLISSCKNDDKVNKCVFETVAVFDGLYEGQAEKIIDYCEKYR